MKFYKTKDAKELTHILLESLEEVNLFLANKDKFWNNSFKGFEQMNSKEPVTRAKMISHTMSKNAVVELARVHSHFLQYKIPVSINVVNDFYNKQMLDFFPIKNNVLVNKVGGYMYKEGFDMDNDFILLLDLSIEDFFNKENVCFEYDSYENNILVFENDPVLDPWTVKHFGDFRVPYICNLREILATNRFEEICTKYTSYYSKKAFIYTTGLDYEQILDYTERAIKCGFKEFTWYFTNDFKKESDLKEFLKLFDIKYQINYIN